MATAYDPKEHGPRALAENRAMAARELAASLRRQAAANIAQAEKKESEAAYWQRHVDTLDNAGWVDSEAA